MNIKFIKYDGIKGYSRLMYNDVEDADKIHIEVAYNGKDIKALLEYLFNLEERIDKAIEYIKEHTNNGMFELRSDTGELNYLLRILEDKEIEEIPQFEGTLKELDNLSIIGDKQDE